MNMMSRDRASHSDGLISEKRLLQMMIVLSFATFGYMALTILTPITMNASIVYHLTVFACIHWCFYFIHKMISINLADESRRNVLAGYLLFSISFTVFYNPFQVELIWIAFLAFPILLSLFATQRVYLRWIVIYSLSYMLYMVMTIFSAETGLANLPAITGKLATLIGSILIGAFIIDHLFQRMLFAGSQVEEERKRYRIHTLTTLIPIAETKTQIPRSEISEMSDLIKQTLKHFPNEKIEDWEVEILTLTHYVSRLQLPDYLFEKQAQLSSYEFTIVKEHCHFGSKLLQEIDAFERIREAFLYHHERVDGTGYPNRLTGEDIPILAQVLGIVEAYMAMTKPKAYRQSLLPLEALDEMRTLEDQAFNKDIVQAFLLSIDNHKQSTRLPFVADHQLRA